MIGSCGQVLRLPGSRSHSAITFAHACTCMLCPLLARGLGCAETCLLDHAYKTSACKLWDARPAQAAMMGSCGCTSTGLSTPVSCAATLVTSARCASGCSTGLAPGFGMTLGLYPKLRISIHSSLSSVCQNILPAEQCVRHSETTITPLCWLCVLRSTEHVTTSFLRQHRFWLRVVVTVQVDHLVLETWSCAGSGST